MRLVVLGALLLAGCGPKEPLIVRVPVPTACVTPAQVPEQTAPLGNLPPNAVQAADALAAKLLEVRGENRVLRGLIIGCLSAGTNAPA